MKSKLKSTISIILLLLTNSCSQSKTNKDSIQLQWATVSVKDYTISLPENFSINYSNSDSVRGIITGENFSIDFGFGAIPIEALKLSDDDPNIVVIKNDTINNYIRRITTTKGDAMVSLIYADYSYVIKMFGDERIEGITMTTTTNLNKEQKNLGLKIFESVKSKKR